MEPQLERQRDNTVLVTGATGFLGRYCLPLLTDRGFQVHAVARRPRTHVAAGVMWHEADLLCDGESRRVINNVRPTHLLHLAWIATPGIYWTSPANVEWLTASLRLAQEFEAQGGRRATIAGSCAEYDWTDGILREESTPLRPNTLYGASKVALFIMLSRMWMNSGPSLAWGRIFNPFGPGEPKEKLASSVCRALLHGEDATCSSGTQRRDFMFVADVADALVALLDSDVMGPVNIGSGEPVSVRELALTVGTNLDAAHRIRFAEARTEEPPLVVADVSRLRTELGWRPKTSLGAGIAQTVQWWKEHLDSNGKVSGSRESELAEALAS